MPTNVGIVIWPGWTRAPLRRVVDLSCRGVAVVVGNDGAGNAGRVAASRYSAKALPPAETHRDFPPFDVRAVERRLCSVCFGREVKRHKAKALGAPLVVDDLAVGHGAKALS